MPARRLTENDHRQDGDLLICVLKLLWVVSARQTAAVVQGPLRAAYTLVEASHTAVLERAEAMRNSAGPDTGE
jgi:hypothetical protein